MNQGACQSAFHSGAGAQDSVNHGVVSASRPNAIPSTESPIELLDSLILMQPAPCLNLPAPRSKLIRSVAALRTDIVSWIGAGFAPRRLRRPLSGGRFPVLCTSGRRPAAGRHGGKPRNHLVRDRKKSLWQGDWSFCHPRKKGFAARTIKGPPGDIGG